jgi:hypothetical protein
VSAEISRLRIAGEAPLTKARRLRDEARDSTIEVSEMLSAEIATLADRCAEAAKLDTMPGGLRDAFRKVAMELESRNTSIGGIMGAVR